MLLIPKAKLQTKQQSKPGRSVAYQEEQGLGRVPFLELHSLLRGILLSASWVLGIEPELGLQRGMNGVCASHMEPVAMGEADRDKRKRCR